MDLQSFSHGVQSISLSNSCFKAQERVFSTLDGLERLVLFVVAGCSALSTLYGLIIAFPLSFYIL